MSERKFVIVDGSSLLSTCYYAVLPREIMFAKTDEEKEKHYGKILHASDGTYTNGIMGVLKAVVSLLKSSSRPMWHLCLTRQGIPSAGSCILIIRGPEAGHRSHLSSSSY